MKKTLLLMAAVVVSSVAVAQTPARVQMAQRTQLMAPMGLKAELTATAPVVAKAPRKALGTVGGAAFYGRPSGIYYRSYTSNYTGYSIPLLASPPFVDYQFINGSADPSATTWYINGRDASANADENNNLWFSTSGAGLWYAPILVNGKDTASFAIAADNQTGIESRTEGAIHQSSEEDAFGAFEPNYGIFMGAGRNDDGSLNFLYGDQLISYDGGTYQEYATYQIFDKPLSPIYITDLHAMFWNDKGGDLIPAGDTLFAAIYNVVTDPTTGSTMLGDSLIALFTATAATNTGFQHTQGSANYGFVKFQNLQDDGFGSVANTPVTVDQAFAVLVTGYAGTGNNFFFSQAPTAAVNISGSTYTPDASLLPASRVLCYNTETLDEIDLGYRYPYYAFIAFNGYLDAIEIPADLTATDSLGNSIGSARNNLLTAPNEGGMAVNEFDEPLYVYSALPWLDENGNENYFYEIEEGDDSWFTVTPNTQNFETYGVNLLNIECDPLPDGVNGRHAVIYYEGKGVVSAPVTIRQGDDTTDGIADLKSDKKAANDGAVYNLAGQRVNNNARGLLVKNGRKYIKK